MSVPSVEFPATDLGIFLEDDDASVLAAPLSVDVSTGKIIDEFRSSLQDLKLDEFRLTEAELLRWLRACSMDLKLAEDMLRKSLKWRKDNDMDNILEWEPPPQFVKEFPFQICGFDHDGDQFGVITYNKWNIDSFIQSIPVDQGKTHLRYFWKCLEMVKKIMRANSTPHKTIFSGIVIIDMDGLAISQFAGKEIIEVVLEGTRQYEANYPGFLKKAIVVNAPTVFSILFQLMRPFLSAETLASVEVYGYYDDWRGTLRGMLPVEQLPSRNGGANTSIQPYLLNDTFLMTPPLFEDVDESTFVSVNVPAGQKLNIDIEIIQDNTKLSWAFRTDYYDITFGVFRVDDEGGKDAEVEVVDFCRMDSHVLMQYGSIICEQPGAYVFRFDNTTSWVRPKTVYYNFNQS